MFQRDPLRALARRLGHRFRNRELLRCALTHRSHANEQGLAHNYERLEFLGDAVLGLVTADWLFGERPDEPEGTLAAAKSYLVSEPLLARWAEGFGVGDELLLGVGEERSGGRGKQSLLADSMEAILGAVFLDGGLKPARRIIVALLEETVAEHPDSGFRDPKTRLQELAQSHGWPLPQYRHVGTTGPDHEKRFEVECWLGGEPAGSGTGRSKKLAEQRAARVALSGLRRTGTDD